MKEHRNKSPPTTVRDGPKPKITIGTPNSSTGTPFITNPPITTELHKSDHINTTATQRVHMVRNG